MTFEDLRKLANEATPGPWQRDSNAPLTDALDICAVAEDGALRTGVARMNQSRVHYKLDADARLIALAPDLARLCAEMADVLKEVDDDPEDPSEDDIKGVLAKLSELEAK